MAGVGLSGGSRVDSLSRDRLHRSRPPVGVTAGDDPLEVPQIGGQVQCEAVADHRAVELDPDRGQLLAVPSDAREARLAWLGVDPELAQVLDERPLQPLEVLGDGQLEVRQIKHRVADQLPRPVVGGLPATV